MKIKNFNHVKFPIEKYKKAERVETDTHRLYRTPSGLLYPSVTSVLGSQPHPELLEWMEKVGPEEAKIVGERASKRGTLLHNMAESYLKNELNFKKANPIILTDFIPIKNALDEHVDNVFAIELQMFSDRLKSAGTTDLIADWDGKQSLIDFKTSRRIKYESDIEDYFLQTSAYSFMVYENFGIVLEDIIILMMIDGDSKASIFKKKAKDYLQKYIDIRNKFEQEYGI